MASKQVTAAVAVDGAQRSGPLAESSSSQRTLAPSSGSHDDEDKAPDNDAAAAGVQQTNDLEKGGVLVVASTPDVPHGPSEKGDGAERKASTAAVPPVPPAPAPGAHAELMYSRYSPARKRFFCFILGLCGVLSPLATTGCLTALPEISSTFHTTGSIINISNGLYTGAMGVSAFIWGVTGALGGRRIVLFTSVITFFFFSLGSALSPNLAGFFVFRILSGFSGTGLLVCGPAVVGDLYKPTERGTALSWIMSGTLIGPAVGPTIGGIIVTYTSWRNIYWFQTALAGLASVLTVCFLPETSHSRRWDNMPKETRLAETLAAFNPVRLAVLFSQPDLLLIALASSSLLWNMYAFFAPIVYVIDPRLHFTKPLQAGLFYLAPGCGYFVATFFGGRYADYMVKKWIRKRGGVRRPQDRLRAAIPWMAVGTPVCMLIYGWCLDKNKGGVALLAVVMFIQGFTQLMIFPAINTYCVEIVPNRATEVLGGNYFIRYMFAAAGTSLAIPATNGIGIGWFCTISVGFILCASVGVLLVIYDKVPRFSKNMQTLDDLAKAG
ncbi:Major facilitator superfamily domain, general substrate transporter [Niveomyces insectorum RCEF 264]|uniref:Major facilitator superfamily domain, general substrate transporter n=1 Tax=Niveomyces insectorum RCEF 264 TaxID=1081102 RepID=A0A167VPF3_9HYPO|nr:Major facilitator superfamily domain, general substrate transporter [Niveomyces insectorum RCEF 264]